MNLGLKLLLLVRQQVDLHVRVGCAAHVHRRQLCSLDDPHYELDEKEEEQKGEGAAPANANEKNLHLHLTSILRVIGQRDSEQGYFCRGEESVKVGLRQTRKERTVSPHIRLIIDNHRGQGRGGVFEAD